MSFPMIFLPWLTMSFLHRIRLNYAALADGKSAHTVLQQLLHDTSR